MIKAGAERRWLLFCPNHIDMIYLLLIKNYPTFLEEIPNYFKKGVKKTYFLVLQSRTFFVIIYIGDKPKILLLGGKNINITFINGLITPKIFIISTYLLSSSSHLFIYNLLKYYDFFMIYE